MSDARQAILARMRHALGREMSNAVNSSHSDAHRTITERLADPKPTLVPARANLALEARIDLFTAQAKAVQANVLRVKSYAELPDVIADYLRGQNLPLNLVTASDERLNEQAWDEGLWEIRSGRPTAEDPIGLTTAVAGIAETGTLMLASDTNHPMTLAFLPETSIITLECADVHRAYEDAFKQFREIQALPRSVNLITGPSRSGDIEQTLQLGAHGPKRLLVILIDQADNHKIDQATASTTPETLDAKG